MTLTQTAAAMRIAADRLEALSVKHKEFITSTPPSYAVGGMIAFTKEQAGAVLREFGGTGWHRSTGFQIADWTKLVDGVTIQLNAMEDLAPRSGPVPPDQIAQIMERHAAQGEAAAADIQALTGGAH